jgi:hypothetical protein
MKKKTISVVLLHDIVIPQGTVLEEGPLARSWGEKNYEGVIGIHKDGTAYFTVGINDAKLRPDLFRVV